MIVWYKCCTILSSTGGTVTVAGPSTIAMETECSLDTPEIPDPLVGASLKKMTWMQNMCSVEQRESLVSKTL
jgi:hypothetical protein